MATPYGTSAPVTIYLFVSYDEWNQRPEVHRCGGRTFHVNLLAWCLVVNKKTSLSTSTQFMVLVTPYATSAPVTIYLLVSYGERAQHPKAHHCGGRIFLSIC